MSTTPAKPHSWVRSAADYGPLILFALAYFLRVRFEPATHGLIPVFGGHGPRDLTAATWWLVGGSVIGLAAVLIIEKRIATIPLMVGGVALVFGTLTLVFHDPIFLKLKPTIVDVSYAVGLLVAWVLKRNPLKALMAGGMTLPDEAWRSLTLRYALFFLASGLVNIVVWQTLSEALWVLYKLGGQLVLLLLFTATQLPFLMKHMQDEGSPPAP